MRFYSSIFFYVIIFLLIFTSCSFIRNTNNNEIEISFHNQIINNPNSTTTIFLSVKPTKYTSAKTGYKFGLQINDHKFFSQNMITDMAYIPLGDIIGIDVPTQLIQPALNELNIASTNARDQAQSAYDKFEWDNSKALMGGAMFGGASGESYEQYQKLREEEADLKAKIKNPPIDYDSIFKKYMKPFYSKISTESTTVSSISKSKINTQSSSPKFQKVKWSPLSGQGSLKVKV